MKSSGMALALAVLATSAAGQEYGYDHGRILHADAGVTLQRSTDTAAEEAPYNAPFMPGDRVWTDGAGRAEFQFPDGTLLRLDSRSKLDYIAHDQDGRDATISVRLWSGSLILRLLDDRRASRLEVETPGGLVSVEGRAVVRIDAEPSETRLSVYEGQAVLDAGRRRQEVHAGEAVFVRRGEWPDEPRQFDRDRLDDFGAWDRERAEQARDRREGRSASYLPSEVRAYASDFDAYGGWHYETEVGYVWAPRVEVGWRPYSNGRWCWTSYGWTWVPSEPWGFAPSHYGRWGFSAGLGWYWVPGGAWSPAWVSWASGGDYLGWCPLGYRNRPVTGFDHAVPRGLRPGGRSSAWNFARRSELASRDVARRRLDPGVVDAGSLRVAESSRLRPTRDLRTVEALAAVPRSGGERTFPRDADTGRGPSRAVPWPGAVARDREREDRTRRAPARAEGGSSSPWPDGAAARRVPAPSAGSESRLPSGRARSEGEDRGGRGARTESPGGTTPSARARPRRDAPALQPAHRAAPQRPERRRPLRPAPGGAAPALERGLARPRRGLGAAGAAAPRRLGATQGVAATRVPGPAATRQRRKAEAPAKLRAVAGTRPGLPPTSGRATLVWRWRCLRPRRPGHARGPKGPS